jgi:geranylgeranyl pyrophosphate synthase
VRFVARPRPADGPAGALAPYRTSRGLAKRLELPRSRVVQRRLEQTLLEPAARFVASPSKGWRARLVQLGWTLAGGARPLPRLLPQLIELVHAGSLIVDDIQDDSAERRGAPALHRRIGVPLALNAGNWLYFVPLELLSTLGVSPATELALHRRMTAAMARCHCGQALDVGLRIEALAPAEIAEVVRVVATLKTGALTELGIGVGALAAGADRKRLGAIERFGRRFGVALQMLDDLGNLDGERAPARRHEDIRLGRPTWVWAWLAGRLDRVSFARLQRQSRAVAAGRLPPAVLAARLRGLLGDRGRRAATSALTRAVRDLERACGPSPALTAVRGEVDRLLVSYA